MGGDPRGARVGPGLSGPVSGPSGSIWAGRTSPGGCPEQRPCPAQPCPPLHLPWPCPAPSPGLCIPPDIAPAAILVLLIVNAVRAEMSKLSLFMQIKSKKKPSYLTIECSFAVIFYT